MWENGRWGSCASPKIKACSFQATVTVQHAYFSRPLFFVLNSFSPSLVFLSMIEQNALFWREKLSAQKPKEPKSWRESLQVCQVLGYEVLSAPHQDLTSPLRSPLVYHAGCSVWAFPPMQEAGSHRVPIFLCPDRAEERKRCEKMQWSFLSPLLEQDVLGREEAEGLLLTGELCWDWSLCSPSPPPYWYQPPSRREGKGCACFCWVFWMVDLQWKVGKWG